MDESRKAGPVQTYNLSDEEREAVQAEMDRLTGMRDKARNALKGGLLSLSQRENLKKALPALEMKIKGLNEKLIADRLLRNCDDYTIPRHFQDHRR